MVRFGLKLFHELGERNQVMEEEIKVYREVLAKLGAHEGGQAAPVPSGEGGGRFDPQELRQWLEKVLAVPLAEEEEKAGGGQRGRGGGSRGRGQGRGRSGGAVGSRAKRPRGPEEMEGVEERRPQTG